MFRGVKASLPKLIGSTPKLTPLVYKSEFYVRVRAPSTINSEFSKERADYRKLLKEYRLRNIKDYWARQTQIENEYIEKWNKLQSEKRQRDLIHLRHNVVKISAGTQRHIEERLKNEGRKIKNLEKYMLEEQNKKANRQHILKMLNFDSKTWFTLKNIEEKMVANVLIPDFVYDQTSYYLKLQEQAILYERADYEGLEENMSEINLIKEKNVKLMPIYEELVNLIKHITYDEEVKYLEEYTHLKSVITNNDDYRLQEKEEKINKLKKSYALLIEKWREESSTTPKKVQNLYKQLIFLYNLLRIWETYIRYVKMDGHEFRMMMEGEKEDAESAVSNLDDIEELKDVDPLKAETLSDAMTSANERATSDSDDEFFTNPLEEGIKTPKHVKDMFTEKPMTAEQVQAKKTEDLFHNILGKSTEDLEKEFDEQFARATDKDRFLYGGRSDKRAIEAAEFLKKNSIESFIPEQEIKGARSFEDVRLDYLNTEQIENEEDYMPEGENPNKLNTSAMVEAYKRELEDLESREKLSRKEKNKLKDIRKLLDRIGEIRVEEGKLLLKVFETFKPKYSLD